MHRRALVCSVLCPWRWLCLWTSRLNVDANSQSPSRLSNAALARFIARKKFARELLYSGAPTEAKRQELEAGVNAAARRLMTVTNRPTRASVVPVISQLLLQFDLEDTADRDRVFEYAEEMVSLLGVPGSAKWLRNFDVPDPSEPESERNAQALELMTQKERAIAEEISSLDAESAERKLTELLGAPHHRLPQLGKVLWFLSPDGNATVSINNFRGKSFVLFLARYRFTFIAAGYDA